MGIHVDLFFLRDNVIFYSGVEGHVLVFLPLVFDVGNFRRMAWFFEFLVLSLIFVGMLLFELWERNACHLSCWGGGFSAQSTICTDLVVCCQLSLLVPGARV